MRLIYSKDEFGKDILLQDNGNQIMMEWEKPYMEACIDKLNPSGRVLEMGFGMGYSANHIQTYENVKEHVIIECSPVVWRKMIPFLEKYPKAKLEKGRWQDILSELGKFDCIFFDDTMDQVTERLNINQLDFIKEVFLNNTNNYAKLVCYCGKLIKGKTSNILLEIEEHKIKIPPNCRYAKNLYIPLFTKINNITEKELEEFLQQISITSSQQSLDELHFNNKELLFNTILSLKREKKYNKLNNLCQLYLKKNTEDDPKRNIIKSIISSQL